MTPIPPAFVTVAARRGPEAAFMPKLGKFRKKRMQSEIECQVKKADALMVVVVRTGKHDRMLDAKELRERSLEYLRRRRHLGRFFCSREGGGRKRLGGEVGEKDI